METAKRSTDRRIDRTKAALHKALMSLILRRRYEAITVKEICEAAEVGRATFYVHYASKDDLKREGLEHLRVQLDNPRMDRQGGGSFAFSLAMFEHARDHLDHYRALVGSRGGAIALAKIRQILQDLVRKELAAGDNGCSDAPRELVVQHVVGAYMAVLTWWLDGGAKLPPERIDAMFRRLAAEGVRSSPRDT